MALVTKRAVVLAKEEATYGSDSTPAAANNAILAFNPVVTLIGEKLVRKPVTGSLSQDRPMIGARYAQLTFSTELYGSGTAGTAPKWGDLAEACGMLETIVASTSVTYTPASSSLKSCSIYVYFDGLLHKILGSIGTWQMIFVAGKPVAINWTFKGLYAAPTDVAIVSPTFDTEASSPPLVVSATFILNSVALVAQQLELNLGAVVSMRPDLSAATGIKGFQITDREANGSFNPEAELVATYNFWTDWTGATQRALSIVVGSGAGKICTVTAPKVTLDSIAHADREGIRIFDIPFALSRNAGDDEVSIAIT